MVTVTLVYPYFRPSNDKSIFRFPPLGLGYIAAYLKQHDISVALVDCTYLNEKEALERIKQSDPKIIGIYSMFSMKNKAIQLAKLLRPNAPLLVAGGPLPTSNPADFLKNFDIVAVGEGEETMLELVNAINAEDDLSDVKGIVYHTRNKSETKHTPPRGFIQNLDSIPFPSRDLFDNEGYKNYYKKNFGYTITSIMTSRGCPFNCDFCSRPVFGNQFRTRSAANVVDELEEVQALGYDRVWFADDCFTLNRKRLIAICDEIIKRRIKIGWECLSRVDTIDNEVASKMKQARCIRLYFGIESGNDQVLALMQKQITTEQAKQGVTTAKQAGIQVGAFFIIGYPNETNQTILDTVKFASGLPLDYLSFTLPYPIPGTPLYEKVKNKMIVNDWEETKNLHLIKHKLLYHSAFSEAKLKFAILKATAQFKLRKHMGTRGYKLIVTPFERLTDFIFKLLR
jgi:anaerobic magnesium-protoporphyrin IX monomethyl ester cyclase